MVQDSASIAITTLTCPACQIRPVGVTVALYPISTHACYLFPKPLLTWQCGIGSFPAVHSHKPLNQATSCINAHATPVTLRPSLLTDDCLPNLGDHRSRLNHIVPLFLLPHTPILVIFGTLQLARGCLSILRLPPRSFEISRGIRKEPAW